MALGHASGADDSVVDQLENKGVKKGVLHQMAQPGQIINLGCEMPQCYCPKGRDHFEPRSAPIKSWTLSADHYPKLKMDGGHLEAGNVRLAHVLCNRADYGWRVRIRTMLEKGSSLEAISEALTRKGIRTPHGHAKWSPVLVRKAFVS